MLLKRIDYTEYSGEEREWSLEGLTLGGSNLLVGRNATGKTRALNIIGGLARVLIGDHPINRLACGDFRVTFSDGNKALNYALAVDNTQVVSESFSVDGVTRLERGSGGEGKIFAERISGGSMIEFQAPQAELAAFVRRDSKQHSFLEPLYQWGSSVRHYHFGTALGKDNLALLVKQGGRVPDGKDPNEIVGLFLRAKRDYPGQFVPAVLRDMGRLDYPIDEIGVGPPVTVRIDPIASTDLVGLWVREPSRKGVTDQLSMSQGMFRVLAIVILTNYLECTQRPGCVVIDDIGEGLDFDRSCLLIDLLREKASKSNIQLITATNDKFIMNRVPLEEWSLLQRRSGRVTVINQINSGDVFEEFRFTGLSNFSFLEMGFADGVPAEAAAP